MVFLVAVVGIFVMYPLLELIYQRFGSTLLWNGVLRYVLSCTLCAVIIIGMLQLLIIIEPFFVRRYMSIVLVGGIVGSVLCMVILKLFHQEKIQDPEDYIALQFIAGIPMLTALVVHLRMVG